MLPIVSIYTDRSHPLNVVEIEVLVGEAMAGQKTDTLTVEYKVYTLHNITCKCMLSSLRTLKALWLAK